MVHGNVEHGIDLGGLRLFRFRFLLVLVPWLVVVLRFLLKVFVIIRFLVIARLMRILRFKMIGRIVVIIGLVVIDRLVIIHRLVVVARLLMVARSVFRCVVELHAHLDVVISTVSVVLVTRLFEKSWQKMLVGSIFSGFQNRFLA